MRKPLPPLTALRAFEAAARHLSLKRAAEELNVTPSAVSHQIQQLEAFLNVQLFRRGHRNVALTDIAQVLAPRLFEGFECLEQAVESVRERRGASMLSIISSPSFASQWLMPRLHEFIELNGEVDVQVSTRIRQFSTVPRGRRGDLESVMRWADESDAVIMLGNGDYPGMQSDRVLSLSITPLCSPQFLQAHPKQLCSADDLPSFDLLHDDRGVIYEGRSFWDVWLRAASVRAVDINRGPHFSHSMLAIDAAIARRGVVASTIELCESAISDGRLVAPFDLRVRWGWGYYLVLSKSSARRPIAQKFREWLLRSSKAGDRPCDYTMRQSQALG